MPENLDELIDRLSVVKEADLLKELERKWGAGAATVATPVSTGVTLAEDKTLYTVVLADPGQNKINVIQTLRAITGLGLKDAMDLIHCTPKAIREGVSKEDARKIQDQLTEIGATVEILQHRQEVPGSG